MVGIKPPLSPANEELARRLWTDSASGSDLVRNGLEVPEQLPATFVMDAEEIDRITKDAEPLSDFYPKRLSDMQPYVKSAQELGSRYFEHMGALERFRASQLIREIWPNERDKPLEMLFFVREARYRSEMSGSNWLAELDVYLRNSRLRTPVLAVQNTDEFRVALAERLATRFQSIPREASHDLIAGALARRDLATAIHLLEAESDRGFSNQNDFFLLTYLYCLNGSVDKAEALARAGADSIQKDWFVDWLWAELQAQFGFRPPA